MKIHQDFIGGNITAERIENDTVYLERQIRDTEGDWFYWAFCAEGFEGRTVTFVFPNPNRVGRFGAAVSYDLQHWHWSESGMNDRFTYTFGRDESKVYFAHNMVYDPARFDRFCETHKLVPEIFCLSVKGRELPSVRFGSGDKWILLTARHHACESTGSYVLEGMAETLLTTLPDGYSVLMIPFVDYDGVLDGDQGKNRIPHDHNRDYTETPVYEVIKKLMDFGKDYTLVCAFDFHSPWHMGSENDYVFFSRSTEAMEPVINHFGEYLKRESAGNELQYTGDWDVGPNEKWNNENSPNSKNYFSKQPGMKLCVTTETPYFGVDGGKISMDAMLTLGHAFGRAVSAYLRENN